jgi:phosphoribosylanthranilate isomerase
MNVQAIAGTGPDYLGFIFYSGSKRYVGDDPDKRTFREVTAGISKVGVFVDEKPENILQLASRYKLQLVQLHGSEPVAYCEAIRSAGFGVIKSFGVVTDFDFNSLGPYLPVCDYFLFDTKSDLHGGAGSKFNWDTLKQYSFEVPFFLSGGIGPEDAAAIREMHHPALYGADINSRFEIAPGIKDIDKVKSFIQKIKTVES